MGEALFIAETALVFAILTVIQIPLRREEHRIARSAVFLLKLILIPTAALLFVSIEWRLPYAHGEILCAVYVAFAGDVTASIIEYIVRRIRIGNEQRHRYDHRIGVPIGLMICSIVLIFGTVNAEAVCMHSHEWQADGLEREHTFAFAADLHAGSQSTDVLRDFCRQVNGSGAEFLIFGGDITDELTTYGGMIETYEILSTIDIPVYMIYGNHDRQPGADFAGGRTYTDEQLSEAIGKAGIKVLTDEFVQVDSDLVLLGREDITAGDARKPWPELVNPYTEGALIVADHQPYDRDQLNAEVSALQLSGHTHAGQLWPLQTVYTLLDLPAYGGFDYPGTHLYVTQGLGNWGIPMRTEARCGWDLITLHP